MKVVFVALLLCAVFLVNHALPQRRLRHPSRRDPFNDLINVEDLDCTGFDDGDNNGDRAAFRRRGGSRRFRGGGRRRGPGRGRKPPPAHIYLTYCCAQTNSVELQDVFKDIASGNFTLGPANVVLECVAGHSGQTVQTIMKYITQHPVIQCLNTRLETIEAKCMRETEGEMILKDWVECVRAVCEDSEPPEEDQEEEEEDDETELLRRRRSALRESRRRRSASNSNSNSASTSTGTSTSTSAETGTDTDIDAAVDTPVDEFPPEGAQTEGETAAQNNIARRRNRNGNLNRRANRRRRPGRQRRSASSNSESSETGADTGTGRRRRSASSNSESSETGADTGTGRRRRSASNSNSNSAGSTSTSAETGTNTDAAVDTPANEFTPEQVDVQTNGQQNNNRLRRRNRRPARLRNKRLASDEDLELVDFNIEDLLKARHVSAPA